MYRPARLPLLAAAVLLGCESALAMGGPHRKTVRVPEDPELETLANRDNRVYGHWLNFRDWFYFKGDTKAFNQFLSAWAALKNQERLRLVLHAGRPPHVGGVSRQPGKPGYAWRMDWARVVRGKSKIWMWGCRLRILNGILDRSWLPGTMKIFVPLSAISLSGAKAISTNWAETRLRNRRSPPWIMASTSCLRAGSRAL